VVCLYHRGREVTTCVVVVIVRWMFKMTMRENRIEGDGKTGTGDKYGQDGKHQDKFLTGGNQG